jgi:hypothetical protein
MIDHFVTSESKYFYLCYIKHEGKGADKQRCDRGLGAIDFALRQIAADITVLALSILARLDPAIKIFRTYISIYAKRSSFGEISRNPRKA